MRSFDYLTKTNDPNDWRQPTSSAGQSAAAAVVSRQALIITIIHWAHLASASSGWRFCARDCAPRVHLQDDTRARSRSPNAIQLDLSLAVFSRSRRRRVATSFCGPVRSPQVSPTDKMKWPLCSVSAWRRATSIWLGELPANSCSQFHGERRDGGGEWGRHRRCRDEGTSLLECSREARRWLRALARGKQRNYFLLPHSSCFVATVAQPLLFAFEPQCRTTNCSLEADDKPLAAPQCGPITRRHLNSASPRLALAAVS